VETSVKFNFLTLLNNGSSDDLPGSHLSIFISPVFVYYNTNIVKVTIIVILIRILIMSII
jgi:hypothetical protein